jgi:hypothetical protein
MCKPVMINQAAHSLHVCFYFKKHGRSVCLSLAVYRSSVQTAAAPDELSGTAEELGTLRTVQGMPLV